MPTSNSFLNAKLQPGNPEPLINGLDELGQGWMVGKLSPLLALPQGALCCVPDWCTLFVDSVDPSLNAKTVGQMIGWEVSHISNQGAPPPVVPPGPAKYFSTAAADLQAWSTKATLDYSDARRLWARRIARSLYLEASGKLPWSLVDYPRWQVACMLSWNPSSKNFVENIQGVSWRGISPVGVKDSNDNIQYHSSDFVWDPDPSIALQAALDAINYYNAKTPRQALRALRRRMLQRRAMHSQQEWTYFFYTGDSSSPFGGLHENNCNPAPVGGTQRPYISMQQWINLGWGGCPVNSSVLAALLNAINVPAAIILQVRARDETLQNVGSFGEPLRVANSVSVRWPATSSGWHRTCYAFGAGLAINHGDQNINNSPASAGAFLDSRLTGWIPWRLQENAHRWNLAVANGISSSGLASLRSEMETAIVDACNDPDLGAAFFQGRDWALLQSKTLMPSTWQSVSQPGSASLTLATWIFLVASWQCDMGMPCLSEWTRELGSIKFFRSGEAEWRPAFNQVFWYSDILKRTALARGSREMLTQMSGICSTEPSALPREEYRCRHEGVDVAEWRGAWAVRVVTLAVQAIQAHPNDVSGVVRLLAAHCMDWCGLSDRSPTTPQQTVPPVGNPPTAVDVHASAFPEDLRFWFQSTDQPNTCAVETNVETVMSNWSAGQLPTGDAVAAVVAANSGPNVGGLVVGGDPMNFEALGATYYQACGVGAGSPQTAPFSQARDVVTAVRLAAHVIRLALEGVNHGNTYVIGK